LVVPNRHVPGIIDANEADIQACLTLVQDLAGAMEDVLDAGGSTC
jgi:diadenosine tetraphosphate (Ap4A) HIT family hydrolase